MSYVRSLGPWLTATVVVLAVGVLAGVAYSFWSNLGSGAGGAASGTTSSVTLSPAMATPGLYPGGSADVALTISNPNPAPVTVERLALDPSRGDGGFSVDAGHTGCDTTALSYLVQSNSGNGWSVPARVGEVDGVASVVLSGALAMSPDAVNACQGATISVHLTAGT